MFVHVLSIPGLKLIVVNISFDIFNDKNDKNVFFLVANVEVPALHIT